MASPQVAPHGQLRYQEIAGKRMAYVDEGQGDAIVVQHGNPTSSYLWRNVMPRIRKGWAVWRLATSSGWARRTNSAHRAPPPI
jgi:pimeloyl-ACP methyl ester carboxylesterase